MLFKEVIGQHTVKERLIRSVQENRISHAQLFCGPEGSGNLALALAYAQYINCIHRREDDNCGECTSCKKMNRLIHPDLHFSYPTAATKKIEKPRSVDFISEWRDAVMENPYLNLNEWYEYIGIENKQGYMSVEESSDIIQKLSLKTFESDYKILIIWMPEKMRTDASNKLLKILEEPPDKTLFILVAESAENLLSTVLSRTLLVKINKISDEEIKTALIEKFNPEEKQLAALIRLADGNFNLARQLANAEEQNMQYENKFITWMRHCTDPKKYLPLLLEWIDEMVKWKREKQKSFLVFSLDTARECLVMNYGDKKMTRFDGQFFPELKKFSPFINLSNADSFFNEINKAYLHIERNANPRILFLDLSFKIHALLQMK